MRLDGTDLQANDLLRTLNNSDPAMTFTLENGGSKINYLDLEVSLAEHSNFLQANFGIFRKSAFSGI